MIGKSVHRLLTLLAVLSLPAVTAAEIVGHWRFDEKQCTTDRVAALAGLDLSRQGGELLTGEGWAALALDGEREELLVTSGFGGKPATAWGLPTAAITAEAWVRVDAPLQWGGIVGALQDNGSFEQGWILGYRGSNFCFAVSSEGADDGDGMLTYLSAPGSFDAGTWYHVAGVYDGKTQALFVDGVLVASSAVQSGDILYPDDACYVLGAYRDIDEHFRMTGALHEVAVHDHALSAAELAPERRPRPAFPLPIDREARLRLGPYVRHAGASSVVIRWETREPSPTLLAWGAGPDVYARTPGPKLERHLAKEVVSEEPTTAHEVRLEDLDPQSTHYFAVRFRDPEGVPHSTPVFTFDTSLDYGPPAPSREPRVELEGGGEHRIVARRLLAAAGVDRGYCLVLGLADGSLAAALAASSHLRVVGVDPDADRVAAARRNLEALGLLGWRVSVHQHRFDALPYTDGIANLIVSERDPDPGKAPAPPDEVLRLLRPGGGVALLGGGRIVRPALAGAGEWTHQYGGADNAACSRDELVCGAMELQWFGRPGPRPMSDRGTRNPAPVSAGGRLYVQGDRVLFGLDAYNGAILWSLQIPVMRRANLPRDSSNMVADGDSVFVAIEDRCWRIDGGTGELARIYELPGSPEGELDWGYVARVDDLLLGSVVLDGGAYLGDDGEWFEGDSGGDVAKVTSSELFAMELGGRTKWRHSGPGIVSSTLTVAGGSVFFVEVGSTGGVAGGRVPAAGLADARLVSLALGTGREQWRRPFDFAPCQYMLYLAHGEDGNGNGFLVASGASVGDKVYHTYAFDAATGKLLWEKAVADRKGHHSGHLQHPVIIGDRIYNNREVYYLRTGHVLREGLLERRGCGTMSASARAIFYRHHFHGMWDLETDERLQWLGIRAGCWLGMIPSGGLLLVPESSAGCSCTHAIQTSVAFRPVPPSPGPPPTDLEKK